jgi:hypothetical protein
MTEQAQPRQLAVSQTLDGIRDAIAAYCKQQRITREMLDGRAGLAVGHSGKLLGQGSTRRFGATSLRWMLTALDLELVLRKRSEETVSEQAIGQACARQQAPQDWRRNRRTRAKRAAAFRALSLTPEQRSAIARKAAQARWQQRSSNVPPP